MVEWLLPLIHYDLTPEISQILQNAFFTIAQSPQQHFKKLTIQYYAMDTCVGTAHCIHMNPSLILCIASLVHSMCMYLRSFVHTKL